MLGVDLDTYDGQPDSSKLLVHGCIFVAEALCRGYRPLDRRPRCESVGTLWAAQLASRQIAIWNVLGDAGKLKQRADVLVIQTGIYPWIIVLSGEGRVEVAWIQQSQLRLPLSSRASCLSSPHPRHGNLCRKIH
jgi:hypothetical protein